MGGPGREWEVGGTNYPPGRGAEFAGTHRLEVAPAGPAAFDAFLHVLQVSDQATAGPQIAVGLSAPDASGVLVRDWVVWFGARGRISGLSYELDAGRPTQVVVGDLAPQTAYQIQVGANTFTESSDQNGVLYFFDDRVDQHTVSVGQGILPDGGSDGGDAGPDGSVDGGDPVGADGDDGGAGDGETEPDGGDSAKPGQLTGGCGCGGSGPARGFGLGLGWLMWLGSLVARRQRP